MSRSFSPTTRFVLVSLAVLALCCCREKSEIVAQVGETTITAEDVSYRQAVVAVRSGEAFPAYLALLQLIEEGLMAEVGRAYDVVVTSEMLADEAARVQDASRDPETLDRIRAVFGDDEGAYRRLVLRPVLVNQLLHARFSLGHDIQAEPLARAQEVLAAAQADPTALPKLAEAFGGVYRQLEIVGGRFWYDGRTDGTLDSAQGTEMQQALAQYDVTWPDYDREFMEQVVVGLAVHELHPRVVEDRYSFMVVRLLDRRGDTIGLETVVIPKLAFGPWFQAESRVVPLVVHDEALKGALVAKGNVPHITNRLLGD